MADTTTSSAIHFDSTNVASSTLITELLTFWSWTTKRMKKMITYYDGSDVGFCGVGGCGGRTTTAAAADDDHHHHAMLLFECQCLDRQLFKPNVPYPAWDYNWDGLMTDGTSMDGHLRGRTKKLIRSRKTRHIILVRHGQYDQEPQVDLERKLTPLGRIQAIKTGRRIANIVKGSLSAKIDQGRETEERESSSSAVEPICHSSSFGKHNQSRRKRRNVTVRTSDMERAKETARLITEEIQNHDDVLVKLESPDPLLNEVLPAPFVPVRPLEKSMGHEEQIDDDQDMVEVAFEKYFYRETNERQPGGDDELHDFEVIICHANIIRYFFCRAIQIPPEAWSRFSLYNCSMSYLTIKPNGLVSARMLGDIGHLNHDESTFASISGFRWS